MASNRDEEPATLVQNIAISLIFVKKTPTIKASRRQFSCPSSRTCAATWTPKLSSLNLRENTDDLIEIAAEGFSKFIKSGDDVHTLSAENDSTSFFKNKTFFKKHIYNYHIQQDM